MRRTMIAALALALGTASVTGVAAGAAPATSDGATVADAGALVPPDQDPFYQPPAGYGSLPNGSVLRSRRITAIYLALPLPAAAYQVLYKSVDGHDQPVAEAATILVPLTPWIGRGPRPLVSYQLAEDSVSTRCQPSYTLRVGLAQPTPAATYEVSLSLAALARNYAVVYADYEGPHSQFIAGPQTAHGVLDGVRAAQNFAPAGLRPDTPVGLWGYSGGGFATTWAAEQQPAYAPELHVVGAAAGGVPADLKAMFTHNNGNIGAGLVILAVIGLDRAYPEAGIDSILNDKGRALFAANNDACTLDTALFHPFDRIENYTTVSDVAGSPQAAFLFHTNDLGQSTPAVPYYDYQATGDELVPVTAADNLVSGYCARGATVQKVRFPGSEHIVAEVSGQQGALQFLADRFDNRTAANDCTAIAAR